MFIAAASILATCRTKRKYPSADERINKVGYSHTMEYYTGMKGMKYTHAATRINPRNIMLSKRTSHKRLRYVTVFTENVQNSQVYRDRH